MQDLKHIVFTNSPTFSNIAGAVTAKAAEVYARLNADEVERLDKTGLLPTDLVKEAESAGFNAFDLSFSVRAIHSLY